MSLINVICANCGMDVLIEPDSIEGDEELCCYCGNYLHETMYDIEEGSV